MSEIRRLKFKTLDNQVHEVEVNKNISIFNLKKIIMLKNGMPLEGQRLIFQGKQLKNEHLLSDYIKEDDQIIHLMCLTPEQISSISQQSTQNTSTSTHSQPLQSTNINDNMNSASIVSMLHNMLNSNTLMPIQNLFGSNSGGNGLNPILNQTVPQQSLQQILQPPIRNQEQTQSNAHPSINSHSIYPIMTSPIDARYNDLLHGINNNLALLSKNMDKNNHSSSDTYNLPITNSTQNILSAISRSLRFYTYNIDQFISQLNRLTDLLEREQLITKNEERNKGNELIKQCSTSFDLISKSSNALNQIISNSNFGNTPNTGFVNVINTEIGILASMSLPFEQSTTQIQPNNHNHLSISNTMQQIPQTNLQRENQTYTNRNNTVQQNNLINGINSNYTNTSQNNNQIIHSQTITPPKENPNDFLNKIINNFQLRKTLLLKDAISVLPLIPHRLFASLVNKILLNMSLKEITDLFKFDLSGIMKQYDSICKMISSSNKDNLLSQTIQFVLNAIRIEENDKHKRNNNSIDIQSFLKNHCILLFDILFQPNINPTVWEKSVCDLFMSWINELNAMLSNVYITGSRGSQHCLIQNAKELLILIIGEEWVNALDKYDPKLISRSVRDMIHLAFLNKNKTFSNDHSFPLMSITEILDLALKDKDRISNNSEMKFSNLYYNSSLFQG